MERIAKRKKVIIVGLSLFIVGFIVGWSVNERSAWVGIYYLDKANKTDSSKWIFSPPLRSFDECGNWGRWIHAEKKDYSYDYMCGNGCKFVSEGHIEPIGYLSDVKCDYTVPWRP